MSKIKGYYFLISNLFFYCVSLFIIYQFTKTTLLIPVDIYPSIKERMELLQGYEVYNNPFTILGSFTYQGDNYQPGPFGYLFFLSLSYFFADTFDISSFIASLYIFEFLFIALFSYTLLIIKKYLSLSHAFIFLAIMLLYVSPRACYTISTQCMLPMSPMPWYSLALLASLLGYLKSKKLKFILFGIIFASLMVQTHIIALPFGLLFLLYFIFEIIKSIRINKFSIGNIFLFIFGIINWVIILINLIISFNRLYSKLFGDSTGSSFSLDNFIDNYFINIPLFSFFFDNYLNLDFNYKYILFFLLVIVFTFSPLLLFYFMRENNFNKSLFILVFAVSIVNIVTLFVAYEEHQFNYLVGFNVFFLLFLVIKLIKKLNIVSIFLLVIAIFLSFFNPFNENKNRFDVEIYNDQRFLNKSIIESLRDRAPIKIIDYDFYNNNSGVYPNFIYELIENKIDFCLEPPVKAIEIYKSVGYNNKGDGNGLQVLDTMDYLNCKKDNDTNYNYTKVLIAPDQKSAMPLFIPGYSLLLNLPNTFWSKCYSEDNMAIINDNFESYKDLPNLIKPDGLVIEDQNKIRLYCGYLAKVPFKSGNFFEFEYFAIFPYFSQSIYIENEVIKGVEDDSNKGVDYKLITFNNLINNAIDYSKEKRNSEFDSPYVNPSNSLYGVPLFFSFFDTLFLSEGSYSKVKDRYQKSRDKFSVRYYNFEFKDRSIIYSSDKLPGFECVMQVSNSGIEKLPECSINPAISNKFDYFPKIYNIDSEKKIMGFINNEIIEQILSSFYNDYYYNYGAGEFVESKLNDYLNNKSIDNKISLIEFNKIEPSYSEIEKKLILEKFSNFSELANERLAKFNELSRYREELIKIDKNDFDINNNSSKYQSKKMYIEKYNKTGKEYVELDNIFYNQLEEIYKENIKFKRNQGYNINEIGSGEYELVLKLFNYQCYSNIMRRYLFIIPFHQYYVNKCIKIY